jgi:hypothetical protein
MSFENDMFFFKLFLVDNGYFFSSSGYTYATIVLPVCPYACGNYADM